MIRFDNVHKAFGGKSVLRGVSLAVKRGEVMFIIGTSGVGKSVTIKHLIGLLRVDDGQIWFDGQRVDGLAEGQLHGVRKRVGMVFQSSTLFDSMTLAENVALPLRKHRGLRMSAALEEAQRRLEQVYMGDFADRYPAELSDGMRKRAAIARTPLQNLPNSGGPGRGAIAGRGAWPAAAPPASLHARMVDPGHLPRQGTVFNWVNRLMSAPRAAAIRGASRLGNCSREG